MSVKRIAIKRWAQNFDGSARTPRKVQTDALEWLQTGFSECPVHVLSISVGGGKSAIARTIQRELGAFVIVPSNILMDQYTSEYRNVNYLKGKSHYKCVTGLTCSEWCNVLEQQPCSTCPYAINRERARLGSPTFFNPMSLYYLLQHSTNLMPACIVVDEAHQLSQMALQLCSRKFQKSRYGFTDKCVSELNLVSWLRKQLEKLKRLVALYQNVKDFEKVSEVIAEVESIGMILQGLEENIQNFAIWTERGTYYNRPETFLHVRAVRVPQFIMHRLLASKKLILMSGTLFKSDIEDLAAGREYRYLDLPSPIPKENRPILYRPVPYRMNVKTEPAQVVNSIEAVLNEFPNRNTIIHTTYDRAKRFAPHFKRPILINTPETKSEILERFKRNGGVFLASGCAEGLDLRDDFCRLNIIPHLIRPNLADPVVAKRRALVDGDRWYALEAVKTCIQQYGRSTRHEKDWSTTVVMDPNFSYTVNQHKADIPKYFTEAISWDGGRCVKQ